MSNRASIKHTNSTAKAQRVVVEPWASEFDLPLGSSCEVFCVGGTGVPAVEMEVRGDEIVFWINTEGAIYEYWQDGVLVD
jgi:hypothetical protein